MFDRHFKKALENLNHYKEWVKHLSTKTEENKIGKEQREKAVLNNLQALLKFPTYENMVAAITFIESLVMDNIGTEFRDQLKSNGSRLFTVESKTGLVLLPVQTSLLSQLFASLREDQYLTKIYSELCQAANQMKRIYQSEEDIKEIMNLDSFKIMQTDIKEALKNKSEGATVDLNRDIQLDPTHFFETAGKKKEEIKETVKDFVKTAILKKHFPDESLESLHSDIMLIKNNMEFSSKDKEQKEKLEQRNIILKKENETIDEFYQFILSAGGQTMEYGPNGKIGADYFLRSSTSNRSFEELQNLHQEMVKVYGEAYWSIKNDGKIEFHHTLHYYAATILNKKNTTLDEQTHGYILEEGKLKEVDLANADIKNNFKNFPDLITAHIKYELHLTDDKKSTVNIISLEEDIHAHQLIGHKQDCIAANTYQRKFQR